MSSFNTLNTTTPYNDQKDVLQIYLDIDSDAYVLKNVIKLVGSYTFSIWHRSEKESVITFNLFGNVEQVSSATYWQKYIKTVKVSSLENLNINISPALNTNAYFYEGFLSEGTLDNSWIPAPEDVSDEIGSKIEQTANEINLRVSDAEGRIGTLETSSGEIGLEVKNARGDSSSLKARIDGIESKVIDENGESIIEQTASSIRQEVKKKVDGDSIISSINQSAEEIKIEASKITLTGAVTFESFDEDTSKKINDIESLADDASETASTANTKLDSWAYPTDKTYINGGQIYTGSITAEKIAAGEITGDKIQADTTITNKLNATNLHVSGASTFKGIINAEAGGTIGGFEIGERDLHNITDDGSIYVGIDGIRSNLIDEDDVNSRSYLLKDGVSEYGSMEDGMYYRIDCSGSELILSSDTYIRNEITERLEPFYRTGEMNFLKTIKYPDSDAEIALIGGIDYKGLYIGGEYGIAPDPILGDETGRKYILTWNNGSLSPEDDVHLLNGKAIRGARTGSGDNVIGYINNTNRAILGHAENTAPTELRSPSDLYLKCNGNITDDNNECGIRFWYTNNAAWFRPCKDGTTNLGGTEYYWKNIYVKNNPIDLSDINHKRDITEIDDRYIKLFDLIEPYAYHFIDGDRVHTGFISQYVEDAMLKVGLTAEELGFFCKDVKTKTVEDDNGELIEVPEYDEDGNLQYIYALRYEEYIAIVTKKVKQLENKIDSQQEQINKLLEMVQAQQKTLNALTI